MRAPPELVGCTINSKTQAPSTFSGWWVSQPGGHWAMAAPPPPVLQLADRDPGQGRSQLRCSQGHIPGIAGCFAVHTGKGHPCAGRQLLGPPPGQGKEQPQEAERKPSSSCQD